MIASESPTTQDVAGQDAAEESPATTPESPKTPDEPRGGAGEDVGAKDSDDERTTSGAEDDGEEGEAPRNDADKEEKTEEEEKRDEEEERRDDEACLNDAGAGEERRDAPLAQNLKGSGGDDEETVKEKPAESTKPTDNTEKAEKDEKDISPKVKKHVAKKRTGGGPRSSDDSLNKSGSSVIKAGPKSSKKKRESDEAGDAARDQDVDGRARSSSPKKSKKRSSSSDSEGSCPEISPTSKSKRRDIDDNDDNIYPDSNMDNIHTYRVDDAGDKQKSEKKATSDFDPSDYCLNYSSSETPVVDKKLKKSAHRSPPSLSPHKVTRHARSRLFSSFISHL